MAVNPEARRAEGVSALPAEALRGSTGRGDTGSAVGTTANLPNVRGGSGAINRDMNANTNLFGSASPPEIETVTADERQAVAQLNDPVGIADCSGVASQGDSDDRWQGVDASSKNSYALEEQHGSFTEFGDAYPANCGDCD